MVLFCSTAVFADLYLVSGQYRFYVNVRNAYFKDINMARGYVFVSGNTARIDVDADGYRRSYVYVNLMPNIYNYNVQVRMEDPFVNAMVVDEQMKYVQYSNTTTFSQNMYWADEYGIRAYVPKQGFEKLTERKIDVRVNGLSSFAPRIYMSGYGDRWDIEIVIKRRDMNQYSNNIYIVCPRDPVVPPPATATPSLEMLVRDFNENAKLLSSFSGSEYEQIKNRMNSLARRIREDFQTLDAEARNSVLESLSADSPLARELKSIQTFEKLHK